MTTEELRELDALIEKHVMGREPTEQEIGRDGDAGLRVMSVGYRSYSADINAVFNVIEKLRRQHLYLLRLSNGDNNWICWIGTGLAGPLAAYAVEDTAPLAICKAALKAVLKMKEKEGAEV